MQHYDIGQTDEQLWIVISRRGSARVKVYILLIAMLLYCGYFVWADRLKLYAGDQTLSAFLLISLAALVLLFWRIVKLMKPDVWRIDRRSDRIDHNGVFAGQASDIRHVLVQCRPGSDHDDEHFTYLVPKQGEPIKVDWGLGQEGFALEEVGQRICEFLRLRVVWERN
jgi:hypothetical protein